MEELERLARIRDEAADVLLAEIRVDARIAEHIRDQWANQNAGSE